MLRFVLALLAAYLAYLLWEKRTNDRCLASFRCVIHVNGIRGKTSVCRMLDAHLRGAGLRVFTKTTGSAPAYIGTDGEEHAIVRRGKANIREQLRMIRRAHRERAEVLILECMAVNPELQRICQERIVKGSIGVITNVRYDHVFDMGGTLDAIAQSLSGTIPEKGVLFTADDEYLSFFREICRGKGSRAVFCPAAECGENAAIALAVGEYLGVSRESFAEHMQGYRADFGTHKLYDGLAVPFLNLFSVNDPQSTAAILRTHCADTADVVFVYNHRADRLDRLLLFIRYFLCDFRYRKIIVMGENRGFARRILRVNGHAAVEIAAGWRDALAEPDASMLVGIGNIKGEAHAMIEYLEEGRGHE